MNSVNSSQVMIAFVCAAWDKMAPAERQSVVEDSGIATIEADIQETAARRFYELSRYDQYHVAGRILLGPYAQFEGLRP